MKKKFILLSWIFFIVFIAFYQTQVVSFGNVKAMSRTKIEGDVIVNPEDEKWIEKPGFKPGGSLILGQATTPDTTEVIKALNEISAMARALMEYIVDKGNPPESNGTYTANSPIYKALFPEFIKSFPLKDPWENPYRIFCGLNVRGKYGMASAVADDYLIVSYGKGGALEAWTYDASLPDKGKYSISSESDLEKDIINLNDSFIRRPLIGGRGALNFQNSR